MKESIPSGSTNEDVNFHSLSSERSALRKILGDTPDDFKSQIEESIGELNTKAKDFSIEKLGSLSKAKEKLKVDKKDMMVEERKIEKEMGDEYIKLSELSKKLEDTKSFEMTLLSRQKQIPNAKTITTIIETINKERLLLEKQISDIGFSSPEVARAFELVKYRRGLFDEGHIAHTPSVDKAVEEISKRMVTGKPIFLHGPTGTGKTSLARLASKHFTGKPTEIVYCNPQTREGNIWGKTGIRPTEGGGIETVSLLGPLAKAMEEGKTITFDEFTALPQEQQVMIKGVFNAKPGDTLNIVGNGQTTIKSGFQMIFTANLKSDKNPERQPLPPEIAREFEQNNLEIGYTPQDESWDIMIARLLNPDGSIDISQYDLQTTLPKFAEAISDIQMAYTGELSETLARETQTLDVGNKKPSLKKLVLTQGTVENILEAWQIDRQTRGEGNPTSFIEFLDKRLQTTLTFKEYPEKDRVLTAKILASKGFLTTLAPKDLDLPSDIFDFSASKSQRGKVEENISRSRNVKHITLGELSVIDPYKRRIQEMNGLVQDFLGGETEDEEIVDKDDATTNPEQIKTTYSVFFIDTMKNFWSYNDEKLKKFTDNENMISVNPRKIDYTTKKSDIDSTKFGEYTINPETSGINYDTIPENKIKIINLPSILNGKPLDEIANYIKTTYPNLKIPGLDLYKYIIENPNSPIAEKLKDNNYNFFFGSLFRDSDGYWDVPSSSWSGSTWCRSGYWLGDGWSSRCRVVLLEN